MSSLWMIYAIKYWASLSCIGDKEEVLGEGIWIGVGGRVGLIKGLSFFVFFFEERRDRLVIVVGGVR